MTINNMPYKDLALSFFGVFIFLWSFIYFIDTALNILLLLLSIPIFIASIFFTFLALFNSKKMGSLNIKMSSLIPVSFPKVFSSPYLYIGISIFLTLLMFIPENRISLFTKFFVIGPIAACCLLTAILLPSRTNTD